MHVIVNDGTKISILEKGQGLPLLLLAGGGFSSKIFKQQIDFFSREYRVIAMDMRSHGQSDRVVHGMRISRLAKDLHDVIETLKLDHFYILAHSLGCSVFYSYLDMFGTSLIKKAILVDQPAVLTANPIWSEEERLNYGATYDAVKNFDIINAMTNAKFVLVKSEIISSMTSKKASGAIRSFIASCFDIDPEAAALLYRNHLCTDWRDVIQRLEIPSLIIGGHASITPWQSQRWISKQILNARLKIFDEHEGGSHFMFVENPILFNQVVADFLIR